MVFGNKSYTSRLDSFDDVCVCWIIFDSRDVNAIMKWISQCKRIKCVHACIVCICVDYIMP